MYRISTTFWSGLPLLIEEKGIIILLNRLLRMMRSIAVKKVLDFVEEEKEQNTALMHNGCTNLGGTSCMSVGVTPVPYANVLVLLIDAENLYNLKSKINNASKTRARFLGEL
ncbi:hypothetical protein HHI36_016834 [Cryptolaemus montrouzieri]|uniref:Uncharacterized protein n=1 Tax=Cryptolaemus montrouzieri TaxID=559131 RepID=A0ABD2NLM0_9CUCU